MTHIRDEADRSFEALREAIAIGEQARISVQISHIKLGTVGVWGKSAEAVRLIEEARRRGVDITADCYPYDAWHSTIRSEEHTSELQSRLHLVCRLLLEKKKKYKRERGH